MTNELQTARYDNLVRRLGGLLGPGSKVTETLSELFPVVETENLPSELLYLGGWVLGMNTAITSGLAGQHSKAQVFNPVGTGKIAVVTDCWFDSITAQVIEWQINATPFAGIVTGATRDTHESFTEGTAVATGATTSAVPTPQAGRFRIQANETFHFHADQNIAVLAPGSGIEFGCETQATTFNATFFWRERVALPSELNF